MICIFLDIFMMKTKFEIDFHVAPPYILVFTANCGQKGIHLLK